MAENIHELNEKNFSKEIASGVTLVDFFAPWCGPCRMLAPVIEEVANDMKGKAKIGKIDIDKEIKLATQFRVSSVPTMVLFKDGKEVDRLVGLRDVEDLKKFIEKELD
ncbi:MAG: thioredoxin [Parachlamydiales bacterium]|nr:thioredoxin [Parachlamydiales bacterium]